MNDFDFGVSRKGLGIHFTLAYVIAALDHIIENDGFMHQAKSEGQSGCVYFIVRRGVMQSVCIVGRFFANEGLLRLLATAPGETNPATVPYDSQFGACSMEGDVWRTIEQYGVTADRDAKEFLRAVQEKQDNGLEWGQALANTKDEFRKRAMQEANEKRDEANRILREADQAVAAAKETFASPNVW